MWRRDEEYARIFLLVCLFFFLWAAVATCGADDPGTQLPTPTLEPSSKVLHESAATLRLSNGCLTEAKSSLEKQKQIWNLLGLSLESIDLALSEEMMTEETSSEEYSKQYAKIEALLLKALEKVRESSGSLTNASILTSESQTDLSGLPDRIKKMNREISILRIVACIGAGGTIGGIADGRRGALVGALLGAAADGLYELLSFTKRWGK